MGALFIIIFLQQWRNYLWPLVVINSANKFTLPLGIANMQSDLQQNIIEWGAVMVVASIITIPVLTIFLIMQRQFISGLTIGSLKE
jgi:ABC-type glycerol-3-phosphate transport system permease component